MYTDTDVIVCVCVCVSVCDTHVLLDMYFVAVSTGGILYMCCEYVFRLLYSAVLCMLTCGTLDGL